MQNSLITLLISSCSFIEKTIAKEPKTITGFLTLYSESIEGTWDQCEGTGAYSDVSSGSDISIQDENGKLISGATIKNLNDKAVNILAEK